MTTPASSGLPDESPVSTTPAPAPVVAAVVAVDAAGVEAALEAVARQVYEVASVAVVGGGEEAAKAAAAAGAVHHPDIPALLEGLDPTVQYVWLLHSDAIPRPDALRAMVFELERNDASLVGSKVLLADQPDHLESVGAATDVFGEPYWGLDEGEVDLEQYDVVRDVAVVPVVSALIRRDLLRGLRGLDPLLPPVAAGLDLCQRARLAGGRVMVVPSAEVLHRGECGHGLQTWREQAGRMRAMWKAYRPVTLTWAVPLGFVVGLLEAVVRLLLGRVRPLSDLFLAVGWNILHLPSNLGARRLVRATRVVGDEELFRYQVSGSVRLRDLATELGERFNWMLDEEGEGGLGSLLDRTGFQQAAPVAATLAVLYVLAAARGAWFSGLPTVGFSLPLPDDLTGVLAAYAGGWNPAGLGAAQPLHPAVGATALLQLLAFGHPAVPGLATLASLLLGLFGTSRLLFRFGVTGPARYLAGVALVLGPAVAHLGRAGYWPGLVAVGLVPWAVDGVVRPWPREWRPRWRRVAGLVLPMLGLAAYAPLAALLPLTAVVLGAAAGTVRGRSAWVQAAAAAVVGATAAAPFLLRVSPDDLLGGGPNLVWTPSPLVAAAVLAAGLLTLLTPGHPRRAALAGWGGLSVAGGFLLTRVPLAGAEVVVAATLLVALGVALVVGAAASVEPDASGVVRGAQWTGLAAAVLVAAVALLALPGGRAFLPPDRWSRTLEFVAALDDDPDSEERVLVVAPRDQLPGTWREMSGYAYRVVSGAVPTLEEAWLPAPGLGDAALEAALQELGQAETPRPGQLLAEFGIAWLVVLGDVPFPDALVAQTDLDPLPVSPDLLAYRNLAARPRVEAADGSDWRWELPASVGEPTDATVRIADNAHPGWGPGWSQDGWANRVSGELGEARFTPDPLARASAWAAPLLGLAALGAALVGRERTR